jgi:hypothetical protein
MKIEEIFTPKKDRYLQTSKFALWKIQSANLFSFIEPFQLKFLFLAQGGKFA